MALSEEEIGVIERIAREHRMTPPIDTLALIADLRASQAEAQGLRETIDASAAFWRPVAADMEHGVLTIDSVRFLAQDFLAMLQAAATAPALEGT